jgi:two-component system response regulator YesN
MNEPVSESARLAFQGLSRRLEEGCLSIYENKELLLERPFNTEHFVKLFFNAIMQESDSSFKAVFESFKNNIEKQSFAPYQYESCLQEFARCFLEESTLHLQPENYEKIQSAAERLFVCASKEQLWQTAYEYLKLVYDLFVTEQHEKYARPVRLAKAYILQHYNDSLICLDTVADKVKLNSAYFSALFKKSCGVGFLDYLQDLRMKKAKELLVQTSQSVKQISTAVGYTDPKHFAKVFKSTNGIRPVEYRKLYE